jgi:hypothetical protein
MARRNRRARLSGAIRDALFRDWGPIGVNESPLLADECASYVPTIYRMLEAGADEVKLAAHLHRLRTGAMGLPSADDELNRQVARRLRGLLG